MTRIKNVKNVFYIYGVKYSNRRFVQRFITKNSSLKRSAQVWNMSKKDHTVLPATHTFIFQWNEPYLPLLPSRRASSHFRRDSFSAPLWIEGWVGMSGWLHLHTEVVYPPQTSVERRRCNNEAKTQNPLKFAGVSHTNRARTRVTSLIETNALPLSQAATHTHLMTASASTLYKWLCSSPVWHRNLDNKTALIAVKILASFLGVSE